MAKGLLGRKVGMTQIFSSDGKVVPVTVVEASPNRITQVKSVESDGYNALQIGVGVVKDKNVTKAQKGHFEKANVKPVRITRELRMSETPEQKPGDTITVDIFAEGEIVDVIGTSKGKGFAGTIKRHNFSRGSMGHGSKSHREPGSMGPRISGGGGKVFKGKKLPGRMGGERVTVQCLTVARVDVERNLILIKGAIPGPKNGSVLIRNTVKPPKAVVKVKTGK